VHIHTDVYLIDGPRKSNFAVHSSLAKLNYTAIISFVTYLWRYCIDYSLRN